MKFNSFIK